MGSLQRITSWLLAAALIALEVSVWAATAEGRANAKDTKLQAIDFIRDVQPLLSQYCEGCHGEKKKGGLDFRIYRDQASALKDRPVFEKMLAKLQAHEMPPENKPQPTESERAAMTNWVLATFFQCDCNHPDPGRVTIRRLNRAEYSNTIRDLVGVDFSPANDFPADDSGYGFDNIGDVLSLSPALMEKYLTAAEKIVETAFGTREEMVSGTTSTNIVHTNSAYNRITMWQPAGKPAGRARAEATAPGTAREIITHFATRAFRRPLRPPEQQRFLALFDAVQAQGMSSEAAMKVVLQAVLVSPDFLFRGELELEPDNPKAIRAVDDYALASRLSYFLWSSMPDDELFAQAARRSLRRNLAGQVKRMLADPKTGALVENFAGQWLELRNLKLMAPDKKKYPQFNETLRAAMQKETELCFEFVRQDNRSILEFIDADYTFVNEELARLYGIPDVTGEEFRRVNLKGNQRGGLLTQASILTLTSNPTRTSPVKRGKWVLENILGAPPPPPPPNVPQLKEGKAALTGSLRQRMEQHRADPNCAGCHARMDPIGFGLENYTGIGAWRDQDEEFAIDASGKLLSGELFTGPQELKQLLLHQKRADFVRCLTKKMLTYALGRGLEYYDKCAVDRITENLAKDQYRFGTLILEIVKSAPFQMRRGEEDKRESDNNAKETIGSSDARELKGFGISMR